MSPGYRGIKTVRKPRELPKPKPEKVKSEPRELEHVRWGRGTLQGLHHLDSGERVVIVKFGDGAIRTIRLVAQYWLSDISSLLPAPLPPPKPARRAAKAKAVEVEEVGDEEPELGEEVTEADERGDEAEPCAAA